MDNELMRLNQICALNSKNVQLIQKNTKYVPKYVHSLN